MPTTIDSMTGVEICIVLIQPMCWLTFPMHGKNQIIGWQVQDEQITKSFNQMPKAVEFGGIGSFLLHYVEDKPHENTEEGEVEVKTNGPE